MGIEDNALDDQHRCRRKGKNGWQCKVLALPGDIYCAKHRLERDIHNEKRKIARPKKGNHFHTEPVLPSGERQCRRNGKRWRCSLLAPPSKIYCQKHELERNAYNVKKKERRKRKDRGLIESDDMKSSTVSKRTKENVEERSFEEVRAGSLKRDSRNDVASEESLFPVNEGVVDEHADKTLNIAQIDSAQSLSPILEEHQMPFIIEDNDVDPISPIKSRVEILEKPQSLNEAEDSLDFEIANDMGVVPNVDIACSFPSLQKKEHRKRKDRGLIESDEMKSSSADCSTVSKRTKENVEERSFEEVRAESLKRDSRNDVVLEEFLFPVNGGVVDEHADKTLSIAQIDTARLLSLILEEHQMPFIIEDNDVDPITTSERRVEILEQPQSLNEVEDSLDSEIANDMGVVPNVDIACSSTSLQLEKAPDLFPESRSCNLPDERSKTAVKEFVGEKQQFDKILARLNIRLEAFLAEVEMKGLRVAELQRI